MKELFFSESPISSLELQSDQWPLIEWPEGDEIGSEIENRSKLRDLLDARPWISEYLVGHVELGAMENEHSDVDDDLAA